MISKKGYLLSRQEVINFEGLSEPRGNRSHLLQPTLRTEKDKGLKSEGYVI